MVARSTPRVRLDYIPSPLRVIRTTQLAKLLSVDVATIWRWRVEGILPPPIQLTPGLHAWRETDIKEWLDSRQPVGADEDE